MFLFDDTYETFEPFTIAHGAAILLLMLLLVTILVFRNKISSKIDLWIRRSLAITMIVLEWTFYTWSLSRGGFNTGLLPLGVCAISMYVTSFALWQRSEKAFQFIFPWAISGALISLTVADLSFTFPHFRFIHYFGNHGLFLLGNIYLLVVCKFKFSYQNLLKSSFILLIYAIVMYPLNFLLDSNHLFLREIPAEVAPMYAFLGDFWVIGFVVSIFALFHLIYLPFLLKKTNNIK